MIAVLDHTSQQTKRHVTFVQMDSTQIKKVNRNAKITAWLDLTLLLIKLHVLFVPLGNTQVKINNQVAKIVQQEDTPIKLDYSCNHHASHVCMGE